MNREEVIEILVFCQSKRDRKKAREYFNCIQRYQIRDLTELAQAKDKNGFKEYAECFSDKNMTKYVKKAVRGFETLKLNKKYYYEGV